jgi:molybdate transport system substrate-binding protein
MRRFLIAAFLSLLAAPAMAQTAELHVLSPGVVYNAGLLDLAASYGKAKGIQVTVKPAGMAGIVNMVKTGPTVTDVMVLPFSFMDGMEAEKNVVPGSRVNLGRVHVGLAVRKGQPHPDISTVRKLGDVLRKGGTIMVSNPASGSMVARIINDMMYRYPELKGVKTKIAVGQEGGEALVKGEGDMALQLICEIVNHPEIELVAKLPVELGAYIDTSVAVSTRSTQPEQAKAFIAYLMQPEHRALWASKGLERFR